MLVKCDVMKLNVALKSSTSSVVYISLHAVYSKQQCKLLHIILQSLAGMYTFFEAKTSWVLCSKL